MRTPLTSRQKTHEAILAIAQRGLTVEKKLSLHLGGYQKRAEMLRGKTRAAAEALGNESVALDTLRSARIVEEGAIAHRLERLRDEVSTISRTEREAQDVYRLRKVELDALTAQTNGVNGIH